MVTFLIVISGLLYHPVSSFVPPILIQKLKILLIIENCENILENDWN